VTVQAAAGQTVRFPDLGERLGPFAVVGETARAVSSEPGQAQLWRHDYLLEPEAVGSLEIPPLRVTIEPARPDPAVGTIEAATRPLAVAVTAVAPPDANLTRPKDIAAPVELPPAPLPPWLWLAGGGLTLGLGLLVLWLRRRRPAASTSPVAPGRWALAELDRLAPADPADPAAVLHFHSRLAEVMRHYLALRFGLPAASRTTEELGRIGAAASPTLAEPTAAVAQLLQPCDLVKFARHRPSAAAMVAALDQARRLIAQAPDSQAAA
jgi:hypothetical protein